MKTMKPTKLKRNFLRDFHKHARNIIMASKACDALPPEVECDDPRWEEAIESFTASQAEMDDFLSNWVKTVSEHFFPTDCDTLAELRDFFDKTVNNYAPFQRNEIDYEGINHNNFIP